jgi:hypothetical protein
MAKYSKGAQKGVESAMKRMEKGTLRSGKSGKKVTNPKQAIAIGLSEAKKKGAKVPVKKTATKKAAPKKKKAAAKKSIAKKKTASTRKPAARVGKKAAPKKAAPKKVAKKKAPVASKAKEQIKKIATAIEPETVESNLPPVEEKSPEINTNINNGISGMKKKDLQRAAARNYDNHHIQLSSVPKGGIKPSGKKPLW